MTSESDTLRITFAAAARAAMSEDDDCNLESFCKIIFNSARSERFCTNAMYPDSDGREARELLKLLPPILEPRTQYEPIRTKRFLYKTLLKAWEDCWHNFDVDLLKIPDPSEKMKKGFEADVREIFATVGTRQIADLLRKADGHSNKIVVQKAMLTLVTNMPTVELTLRFFKEGFKDKYN